MKFPELIIENFLAITGAKVNLADRGLVGIQGVNHADTSAKSNGAGKSSIADALSWCWFGVTARDVSGDDVINAEAKKGTRVVSVLVDGHMTYTATRHRKHKTGKNTFTIVANDGLKDVDLTKGTEKLTQEVANKIIGSSLEVFNGSIYAGQEAMPDLPAMTDKHLKMLIEEAAGVTVLEAAYKKAREDAAAAQASLLSAQGKVTLADNQAGFLRAQLHSAKSSVGAWDGQKRLREEEVKRQIGEAIPQLKALKVEIDRIDRAGIEAKIADCDAKIAAVSGEQAELRRLEGALNNAQRAVAITKSHNVATDREVTLSKAALDGVQHKVGCPCTECGRPLTNAELASATAAAEMRYHTALGELAKVQAKLADDEIVENAALVARDDFAGKMTDVSSVAAQRALSQRELASADALAHQQTTLVSSARSLRDRLALIGAETNPHHATVERLEKELAAAEAEVTRLEAAVVAEEAKVALEAEVVKVFSPAGVRAHILDDVTPFLNSQTAKYLATLSDGNIEATWSTLTPNAKGELKEKFSIDVTNATGGKVFKGLSGGEKRKVRLATALALQDLVATRATKPIDLFIGDEIDDALDAAGLERLTMVLEEKARERGSVFIISHNELRDHLKQVLVIEKGTDGKTKVTEMAA